MTKSGEHPGTIADIFGAGVEDFRRRMETKKLNVVVVGKVSTGKSSLINALFGCTRGNPVATVGARSGVTTGFDVYDLTAQASIIDTPGLDDLKRENSEKTQGFLAHIHVGILVVTGSADASQQAVYQDLCKRAGRVFVVLNKVDAGDDLEDSALNEVMEQWCGALATPRIYPTCTRGYDPQSKPTAPIIVRGVEELREDIYKFLATDGSEILFAACMRDKRSAALRIIVGACIAVAGEAFVPGPGVGTALTTSTQVTAISALYYAYTGRYLASSSVLALLPAFLGKTTGETAFLFLKSMLPPTGLLDVMAAGVAVAVTLPMLLAVSATLASGAGLEDRARLKDTFSRFQSLVPKRLGAPSRAWKTRAYWTELVRSLMYG